MPLDVERAMEEAVAAATAAFKEHGVRPAVVVNVVFKDSGTTWAFGSLVPRDHREMMAESLHASAKEASDAG